MRRGMVWTRVKGVEWQHMACTTPRFPSHWWFTGVAWVCPVHHQEDGKSDVLDEGVEHHNGVGEVSGCHQTIVCVGHHCVVIQSVSPSNHVGVHHVVCGLRCVMGHA